MTPKKMSLPDWSELKGHKSMTLQGFQPRRLSIAVDDDVALSHHERPYTPLR